MQANGEGPSDMPNCVLTGCPTTLPPCNPTFRGVQWMMAKHEEKRQMLKNEAEVVEEFDDNEEHKRQLLTVHRRISADPNWTARWRDASQAVTFSDVSPESIDKRFTVVITEKQEELIPAWFGNNFLAAQYYNAPKTRIRITRNCSGNDSDPIPIYSDIAGETVENVSIPDSLLYQYADRNYYDAKTEVELVQAVEMANDPQNSISCQCCSSDGRSEVIRCFENEACPCFQMNKKLRSLQKLGMDGNNEPQKPAIFNSFDPLIFHAGGDPFFENVGFSCSDSCACAGNCTNNSLYLINQRIVPFEVYRSDPILGFGIRSPILIPAGTPLMDFTGMINQSLEDHDYAYQLTYKDERKLLRVIAETSFTDAYKKLLRTMASKKVYYVNPRWVGNISRTANHSCSANATLVRVFEKSLSPAHCRLLMVSLQDIYPGVPITIDYGSGYVEDRLNGICACKSLVCHAGKHYKSYKRMDRLSISACFEKLSLEGFKKWNQEVKTPAWNEDNSVISTPWDGKKFEKTSNKTRKSDDAKKRKQ